MQLGPYAVSTLFVAGFSFSLGITFLLDCYYNRRREELCLFGVFSLLCLVFAARSLAIVYMHSVTSLPHYLLLFRAEIALSLLIGTLTILFVVLLTHSKFGWWFGFFMTFYTLCFVANALSEFPLGVSDAIGLKTYTLPWGEQAMMLEKKTIQSGTPLAIISILSLLYAFMCCIEARRKMPRSEVLITIVCYIIATAPAIQRSISSILELEIVPFGQFGAFGFMLLMGSMLSARHGRQSRELIRSHADLLHEMEEHRRSESEKNRLWKAVEQADDAIVVTDANGTIEFVNPAFERVTGYTPGEILGQNPRLLKSGAHDREFYEHLWSTLLTGNTWRGRFKNRRKDGTHYEEECTISPVVDTDGRVTHFASVRHDCTKELGLREQLRQAQKMESIGRLAGGVAHDFNNMLAVTYGYAEMLLEENRLDGDQREYVQEIFNASERARRLTHQLLAFSRKQTLDIKTLDLNRVVRDIDKMIRRLLGEDIDIQLKLDPEIKQINADVSQLEQVLMNICVNARDAMPQGGLLLIKTANGCLRRDEDNPAQPERAIPCVVLSISDNGCGMDEATKANIFEPFFTTKEEGKGTGLGLATVYGIVKQHGGEIILYSEPGFGTTFKIFFPNAQYIVSASDTHHDPQSTGGRGETIVLVEDDEAIGRMLARILGRMGYKVIESTPCKVITYAQTGQPIDLLITDVIMPEMNGRQLHDALILKRPGLRTLFMSGYPRETLGSHGVLEEGLHFISKPFTEKDLALKLRSILDE